MIVVEVWNTDTNELTRTCKPVVNQPGSESYYEFRGYQLTSLDTDTGAGIETGNYKAVITVQDADEITAQVALYFRVVPPH